MDKITSDRIQAKLEKAAGDTTVKKIGYLQDPSGRIYDVRVYRTPRFSIGSVFQQIADFFHDLWFTRVLIPRGYERHVVFNKNLVESPSSTVLKTQATFENVQVKKEQEPSGSFHDRLSDLNLQMQQCVQEALRYEQQSDEEYQKNLPSLTVRFKELCNTKSQLIADNVKEPGDRIYSLKNSGSIQKGTKLYHATESLKNIRSIVQEGIIDPPDSEEAGTFGAGELGKGVYANKSGVYGSDALPYVLVIEAMEEVPTTKMPYKGDIMDKPEYASLNISGDHHAIAQGFTRIGQEAECIQSEGLPPKDNEYVLRNPQGKWKIVGWCKYDSRTDQLGPIQPVTEVPINQQWHRESRDRS